MYAQIERGSLKEIFENVISSESFWTVITGMIVYILSQYYMEFFANPRKEYKKLRQRIIYTITMYCCYYTNPYNPFKENKKLEKIIKDTLKFN